MRTVVEIANGVGDADEDGGGRNAGTFGEGDVGTGVEDEALVYGVGDAPSGIGEGDIRSVERGVVVDLAEHAPMAAEGAGYVEGQFGFLVVVAGGIGNNEEIHV